MLIAAITIKFIGLCCEIKKKKKGGKINPSKEKRKKKRDRMEKAGVETMSQRLSIVTIMNCNFHQ